MLGHDVCVRELGDFNSSFQTRRARQRDGNSPDCGVDKVWEHASARQKLHEIERRTGLCPDMLRLLHTYASFKKTSKLIEYALSPQDFDIMNHICFDKRLKTRDVTNVKKKLRDECDSVS